MAEFGRLSFNRIAVGHQSIAARVEFQGCVKVLQLVKTALQVADGIDRHDQRCRFIGAKFLADERCKSPESRALTIPMPNIIVASLAQPVPEPLNRSIAMLNKMFIHAYATVLSLGRDEEGASAVEYGLILGLIAVVIIATLTTVGTDVSGIFNKIATKLAPILAAP